MYHNVYLVLLLIISWQGGRGGGSPISNWHNMWTAPYCSVHQRSVHQSSVHQGCAFNSCLKCSGVCAIKPSCTSSMFFGASMPKTIKKNIKKYFSFFFSFTFFVWLSCWNFDCISLCINRTGETGAVFVTHSLTDWLSGPLWKYFQRTVSPKAWELESWHFERMFMCNVSHVTCHVNIK